MLWRVVITNSETLDGIAPVCPQQMQPGGPHHQSTQPRVAGLWTIFTRDLWFDRHGIYDCCPPPHLWAPDAHTAAELADMMSACGVQAR